MTVGYRVKLAKIEEQIAFLYGTCLSLHCKVLPPLTDSRPSLEKIQQRASLMTLLLQQRESWERSQQNVVLPLRGRRRLLARSRFRQGHKRSLRGWRQHDIFAETGLSPNTKKTRHQGGSLWSQKLHSSNTVEHSWAISMSLAFWFISWPFCFYFPLSKAIFIFSSLLLNSAFVVPFSLSILCLLACSPYPSDLARWSVFHPAPVHCSLAFPEDVHTER